MASDNDNGVSPESMRNTFKIAMMSSVLLLTGSLATGFGNWLASAQTARVNEKTSCIARLDKQEDLLRSKGDAFIGSLGSLSAYFRYPTGSIEAQAQRMEAVSIAGFSLSAYASEELRVASGELVNSIFDLIIKLPDKPRKGSPEDYKSKFDKWTLLFQTAMDDLNLKRIDC